MKPKHAKLSDTRTRRGKCQEGEACPICLMCVKWNPTLAKCRQCYPDWPIHCLCRLNGMVDKAKYISYYLDKPLWDPTGKGSTVNFLKDEHLRDDEELLRGSNVKDLGEW